MLCEVATASAGVRLTNAMGLCQYRKKKIQESGKGSDKVMEDLKGQLQLLWAFFCLPSTSVLNLLA